MKTMHTQRLTTMVASTLIQDAETGVAVWLDENTQAVFHAEDIRQVGASIPLAAWPQGQDVPYPWVATNQRRVTARPLSHRLLQCQGCGQVSGCLCGPSTAPSLDQIVIQQRQRDGR